MKSYVKSVYDRLQYFYTPTSEEKYIYDLRIGTAAPAKGLPIIYLSSSIRLKPVPLKS